MKYNMKIEHLPSGRTWVGDSSPITPEELTELQNLCKVIAKGDINYLEMPSGNITSYFNESTLKDCVVCLVKGE